MGDKKVIAYCLHEHEMDAVRQHIKDAAWTESYAVGTIDEAAIKTLEERGILVEQVEETPPPEPVTSRTMRSARLRSATATAGPDELPGEALPPSLHPTKDNVFVVVLDGPILLEPWRKELEGLGVRFFERRHGRRYLTRLSLAQVAEVRRLPYVRDVRLLSSKETTGAVFSAPAATRGFGDVLESAESVRFDVLLHEPDDLADVEQWLNENQVEIVDKGKRKLRVALPRGSARTREIQALPGVAGVQEFVPPQLANERARRLLGLDPAAAGGAAIPQTGAGEIVAVADSGLDDAHPAFTGRVVKKIARGRPPSDASDPHGHGTHVAGSVLGAGATAGAARGTAPDAKLVFQSIMDGGGGLGGLPLELSELFDEAYQAGARIHNNSWSANTKSFYTFNSLEVDEFVHQHPDMLIVIAAGNEGSALDPPALGGPAFRNTQPGFVEWLSIGSPATAKNALTVGASRSDRNAEGLAQKTWKEFSSRFADPPIAAERISGDPQCLAAFSSRGPCDSIRIKPDVVAPGTDILSARAATAPTGNFWSLSSDPQYAYMGGTSMASPLVSGCAALVRQYYREQRNVEPSAALLKATLVNSTRWLSGADAIADNPKNPNYHQGFGAVYMPYAIPNPIEPWMKLEFVDTWKDPSKELGEGGARRRFAFTVVGGKFLRICLAWTDPPGPGIQNSLALIVEAPPNARKLPGNSERPVRMEALDRDNNVQIVRLDNPPPGNYSAIVMARNLLKPPQGYALVVIGDLGPGGLQVI
ncbi:MAG TPA: S8 family serine peptidase [Thermoanaerobaculia bacterium]|nr:S8 family serine peptidase [Thermoanaerobaculia bacterium]